MESEEKNENVNENKNIAIQKSPDPKGTKKGMTKEKSKTKMRNTSPRNSPEDHSKKIINGVHATDSGTTSSKESVANKQLQRNKLSTIFATLGPRVPNAKEGAKILKEAGNLFKKTNRRVCQWIHPKASRPHIGKILDDIWETSSPRYKRFFVWKVLQISDPYRSRYLCNARLRLPPRRRKDPRLDLLKILPPPQPVTAVPQVQKCNPKRKVQATNVPSVAIKSNDGKENCQNVPPKKKPKKNTESKKNKPKSKSTLST